MQITTHLIHFDERSAVCAASLEEGEQHVTLYASALAVESQRYADLAQQRAVALALDVLKHGVETLEALAIEASAAEIITEHLVPPQRAPLAVEKPAPPPEDDVPQEASPAEEEEDDTATLSVGGAPW